MTSNDLRIKFLNFFASKNHKIVPSAPVVIKHDPTLMFTNAGMNQFKDIFLGNMEAKNSRIANSQKCLRVSGKHNDLEQVGHDTYHHTMFEMLGNWSFGDYFKQEAIEWAWEFLTVVLGISPDRLYATVFEGDSSENIEKDNEAYSHWKKFLPDDRILTGSKKDNFWEMGDTGPCGPCSEIHCDIRDDEERKQVPGNTLINTGNPLLIEIWNLVFIQYNRKADGSLEILPKKHVDTGMGFERLCMIVQGKKSNYDTDIFTPLIRKVSEITGISYGNKPETDTAMRVLADHLRAVAFSIADGQLPTNVKAGYVIRRILRRAVRYAYTFLLRKEPVLYILVPELVKTMGESYPELKSQQSLIEKVIREEESAFLRTLENGIRLLDQMALKMQAAREDTLDGKDVFILYDTYGFPPDLTQLILKEKNLNTDLEGFENEMNLQKSRSKMDAVKETGDWVVLAEQDEEEFVGYDLLETEVKITRFRKISYKGEDFYHLIFDKTPFYAESGGQVGDTGYIISGTNRISVINTIKENNLVIHLTKVLPPDLNSVYRAVVDGTARRNTENNHSATHLLHHVLRKILGNHVEQKGSLVHPDYLRFDFSHFKKVSDEEIRQIETEVNRMIRENIHISENRNIKFSDAQEMGAMALFGEKYGETVRVVRFDDSIELCGGTHVERTGRIGFFKIIRESAIAAGIRRIEAVTGEGAERFLFSQSDTLKKLEEMLSVPGDPLGAVEKLMAENAMLKREVELMEKEKLALLKNELWTKIEKLSGFRFLSAIINTDKVSVLKDLSFLFRSETDDLFLILGAEIAGKAHLSVMISDRLVSAKKLNASDIIRKISSSIGGSGGGQPFFATAGGKNPSGLVKALEMAKETALNIP